MLCSDGIFDRMTTKETIETSWKQIKFEKNNHFQNYDDNIVKDKTPSIHETSGQIINRVMTRALNKKATDNLSCIIISFDKLKNYIDPPRV